MNDRELLRIFSATLFTSAFLIFSVQPVIGKMLLPLLGGSPSVWNIAMVFFQAMMLAGYAYAHFIARFLPLKAQGVLHVALLAGFMVFLPFSIAPEMVPPASGQAGWQLGLMLVSVGGPFFILAASAPLFQHWFASGEHPDSDDPYFLYALSNAGSMAALLGYPFLIEPLLTVQAQTWSWFAGYIVLTLLAAACAYKVRHGRKPIRPHASGPDPDPVGWKIRLSWIFLAFIPSSLMIGVTTLISTDLATAPLLWLIPLSLYLLTFILAFARNGVINLDLIRELAAYSICFVILSFLIVAFAMAIVPMITIHLIAFFLCAQLCHGEIARLKPAPSQLTEFYLLISLGGVLGGIFNALIAPRIFLVPLEYPIMIGCALVVIWAGSRRTGAMKNHFNTVDNRAKKIKIYAADLLILLTGVGLCIATYFFVDPGTRLVTSLTLFCFLFILVANRPVFTMVAIITLLTLQPGMKQPGMDLLALERNYLAS